MNLAVLEKSRKRLRSGDLFALKPVRGAFLFGRVIQTGVNAGGFPTANLIYIYRTRSRRKDQVPELRRDELLVPPIMTNNLPWRRGYFEPIGHESLSPDDVLPQHHFQDPDGRSFDQNGREIDDPQPPIGSWGLDSFRTIDDKVSEALGLSLAPD